MSPHRTGAGAGGQLHALRGYPLPPRGLRFLDAGLQQQAELAEVALRVTHDLLGSLLPRADAGRGQAVRHHLVRILGPHRLQRELPRHRLAHSEAGSADQEDAEQRPACLAQAGEQAKVAQRLRKQRLRVVDRQHRRFGLSGLGKRPAQHWFQRLRRKLAGIANAE